MATLIPALGTCISRMTNGERRLGQRLEQKLEDDWLIWYDVPIGPNNLHPDFIVFSPHRGIVVIEVKDWRLEKIQEADRQSIALLTENGLKRVVNPLEQARQYAHAVVDLLKRDSQLALVSGRMQGNLLFPWGYGVVLAGITRKQFDATNLCEVIDSHRVICSDEMTENVDPEAFQKRLWEMVQVQFNRPVLSMPQIDRIRWHLFPEVRINPPRQSGLFDALDEGAPPEKRCLISSGCSICNRSNSRAALVRGIVSSTVLQAVAKP